ncbi:MAG: PKD domain-containing protein [Saprospiraceae bacterium]|nr:PKD domain-containing protein [Saprospiraceae bacterium]
MTRVVLLCGFFLFLFSLPYTEGQNKTMIKPDHKKSKSIKNMGSEIINTKLSGTISPMLITQDWGVELKNYSAFHHTSPVSKEEFLAKKEEANKVRISHAILPVPSQLQMDSLIPILNKNFRGNLRGSSVPMDNTVAISKNGFIVSAINTNVIFTQPDGEITYTKALSDFFFLLNLGTRMYDPRVIYDQGENKFIFMCLHGSDPASTQLCIAFSKTEDPNGEWNFYKVNGNPGDESNWFDYPNIAVSSHDFYVAGLMRNPGLEWQYSVLYQMDKMDGFNGRELRWKHYNELFDADEKPSFNLVPTPSGWSDLIGPGMYFVSNEALGGQKYNLYYTDESLHNNPVLFSLQTTGRPTSLAPDGRQKGSNERLNTFDSRIWSAMYLDGTIHMGSHVNTPSGNVGLFYGRMNIEDLSVQATVLETDSIDYGFPSFSGFGNSEESDTILVNYLFSGPKLYASQQQRICHGRNDNFNWSEPTTLKDGISVVSVSDDNRERWGDYTTSCRRFLENRVETWVTGCFGEGGSYGTWLGQYISENEVEQKIIPEFVADKTTVEQNTLIKFKDISRQEGDEYLWRFEGGIPETSTLKNPEVTYSQIGAYDVSLKIKKGSKADSIKKSDYILVTKFETIPIADFTYDKDTIFRNDTVTFLDQSSENAVLLNWIFAQGVPGASNEKSPKVRYPLKGSFTVNLTAVNIAGTNTKSKLKAITVFERFSPTADFSTDKIQIMPGDSIHFNDISKGGPTSWEWQFEGGNPSSSTQKNPIVKYPQEGSYDVVLKVKNQFGENIITRENYIVVGESSVFDEENFKILSLYPNPSFPEDKITVQVEIKDQGIHSFEILDHNGRIIKTLLKDRVKSGENILHFNTTHLSSGQYYLKVQNEVGERKMIPFIVI